MKKLLLALAFVLVPGIAGAQCTGVFPAKTLCGNLGSTAAPPSAFSSGGTIAGPVSSTVGHIAEWNNTTGTLLKDFDLFGGTNTFTGSNTFSTGTTNFTGTFQVGGQTFTWPAAGTVVGGLGTNQTWTGNNTFSTGTSNFTGTFQIGGATVTLPVSAANGGTGVASPATHTIPINQGASAQANSGTGTLGQGLVSNGASADPSFKSGTWTLINTLTAANSASLSDTTSLTASYNEYEIILTNLVPVSSGVQATILVHSGGTYPSTSYINGGVAWSATTPAAVSGTGALSLSNTTNVSNNQPGISGIIRVSNPTQSSTGKLWVINTVYNCTANPMCGISGGAWWSGGNSAIDGFQFSFSTGNIASGTIKIYGKL
jgi:hypothetical protein